MKKKSLLLVLSLVLAMTMTLGGTLAYLTDRDAKTNIFTIGNVDISLDEDFEQGAELLPGQDVTKIPTITNEGTTDAWVWMTVAIPAGLENINDDPSLNALHWNFLSSTVDTDKYAINPSKVAAHQAAGYLDDTVDAADLQALINGGDSWKHDSTVDVAKDVVINANEPAYNVYTFKYITPITPGEETLAGPLVKVYLDAHVDIDPEGNMYRVENGVATDLGWNINENGFPKVYVAAYAVQAEGFGDVDAAYAAYGEQWGSTNNVEYPTVSIIEASTSEELAAAITNLKEGDTAVVALADGEYTTNLKIPGGTDVTISGSSNVVLSGQIASTSSTPGTLTLSGVTVEVDDTIVDSTGISQTGKSAIALWGTQTVVCDGVTFNMSLKDSTAITAWWDTGIGTSIIVRDCTFNCNGQRPIRATGNVTVENTTFNDPYRYAVQLTAKASTATELDKAIINFKNNTIVNGENGKAFVYGIQLEGADYGCNNCVINGAGNTIENGGADSTMYYCECGKVDHATIEWNVEATPVHEAP